MRIFLLIAISLTTTPLSAADPTPLPQAHAHNDYLHARPLLDALDHGFTSVEADIFLVDSPAGPKLPVAHFQFMIDHERTLQTLYLDPLRERIKARGDSVYGDGKPFHLLIDLKTDGEPTYRALSKVLAKYDDIITSVDDGKVRQKAVNVTISGNRPVDFMKKESLRYAGIDGRWSDLDSDLPAHLMPLVSDNWSKLFTWKGEGPMPAAERKKLADAVSRTHARGRKLRLWATPDKPEVWRELQAAGVDQINADDLAGLEKFLRDHKPSQ